MAYQQVIETSTGDCLRAGFENFTAGPGESLRSDGPFPTIRRSAGAPGNYHRWTGVIWITVPQPAPLPQSIPFGILTGGDVRHSLNSLGPILIDRQTGSPQRIYIQNGQVKSETTV